MSPLSFAALLYLAASGQAAATKAPAKTETLSAYVRFQAPKDWRVEEHANSDGADPVKSFVSGEDRLSVRLFGASGSAYKTPAAFLSGAAASTMGRKPEKMGKTRTAGREVVVYQRGFPLNMGDPHTPSGRQQLLGREIFVLVPAAKGRFVVISYARESPAPDLLRRGEQAWEAFLKTVSVPGRKT